MILDELLTSLPKNINQEIQSAYIKAYTIINKRGYKSILCSISGGSDSDVVLDIIRRVDFDNKVKYIWFDTGLEYKATKDHIKYLKKRYGIEIVKIDAIKVIPVCVKEYGQPFLSKQVSEHLSRLQNNGFKFENDSYDELITKYPNCKSSLKWWCNQRELELTETKNVNCENQITSRFDISRNKWLKEFLIANPPTFKISAKCCDYAKKKVSKKCIKDFNCDLMITGVRKAEGGVRATAYKNCYTHEFDEVDSYRPIFWFKNEDKKLYEKSFAIRHSDCYEKWGFKRTGCAGCPFGRNLAFELNAALTNEPNFYKAANTVFKDSYDYTKKYRQFVGDMNDKEKGRKRLF